MSVPLTVAGVVPSNPGRKSEELAEFDVGHSRVRERKRDRGHQLRGEHLLIEPVRQAIGTFGHEDSDRNTRE